MVRCIDGLDCVALHYQRFFGLLAHRIVIHLVHHVFNFTLPAGAALLAFRRVTVILLEIVVANCAFTQVSDFELVLPEEELDLLGLVARLLVKLVISDALAHFLEADNIALKVATVCTVDCDHPIHQLALQFDSLVDIDILGDLEATTESNGHVLVVVDLALDAFRDAAWVLVLSDQLLEVLRLLDVQHLEELLAHLPVVSSDEAVGVEGLHLSPLVLEIHVELADTINRVSLLPDLFQSVLFHYLRWRVGRRNLAVLVEWLGSFFGAACIAAVKDHFFATILLELFFEQGGFFILSGRDGPFGELFCVQVH